MSWICAGANPAMMFAAELGLVVTAVGTTPRPPAP